MEAHVGGYREPDRIFPDATGLPRGGSRLFFD